MDFDSSQNFFAKMYPSWNATFSDMLNLSTNWTSGEEEISYSFGVDKIILLCIYIPVFAVALIGNILVLVMVCMNKSVRRNVANYFLVNLAVADLLGKKVYYLFYNKIRVFVHFFMFYSIFLTSCMYLLHIKTFYPLSSLFKSI